MSENGLAIMRNPCLRCVDKDLCGICELNILRQKEQPPKRVEYKKTEEIQMRTENENQATKCECTEACNCTPCNPYEATVPLMLSPDYKARFVAEYRQTKIRYVKLKAYCNRRSTPLLCLERVPDLPVAPQDEAGLTKTFQTWPRGWFHIP